MRNLLTVAMMSALRALMREESRGSHYRSYFTGTDNKNWQKNICLARDEEEVMCPCTKPVLLNRLRSEEIVS